MDKWLAPALSGLSTEFTDCCVIVESQKFKCHKIILASASDFFKQMLLSDFKESASGETDLQDVTPEIFEKFRNYVYTYNKFPLLSYDDDTIIELYQCGHKWLVPSITDDCLTILCDRAASMKAEDLINLYELAHKFEDKMFILKVTHYLMQKKTNDILCERALSLEPSVFMQYVTKVAKQRPEIIRYRFISLYIDLHGFDGHIKSKNDANNKLEINDIKTKETNVNSTDSDDNDDTKLTCEINGNTSFKLKVDFVKLLLQTVNYDQMTATEFYEGPGKSELFTYQMKYEHLYNILRNTSN